MDRGRRSRSASSRTLHYGLSFKKDAGFDPDVIKKVFGKALDIYVAVSGTRFLATFGHDAKANLGALAAATPVAPTGALAETLAATKGRDSFFQFDLGPVLSLIPTLVKDKKAAAFAKANVGPIPLYGSAGGDGVGKVWSLDLHDPACVAFVNAGGVIREAMRANAGGGSPELAAPPKIEKKHKK